MTVTDYKTGGASNRWQGKSDMDKLKLHKYRQQLMFYKLLVEHSRDYAKYTVDLGVLQFVEPTPAGDVYNLTMTFDSDELQEFSDLLQKTYGLITSLTLPDTTAYPATYAGVLAFEADIKAGKY
jgi:DNA helicase II / ATP-dependent DNA helicase PcrA